MIKTPKYAQKCHHSTLQYKRTYLLRIAKKILRYNLRKHKYVLVKHLKPYPLKI